MSGINGLIYYVHENGWGRAVYDSAFPIIVAAQLVYYLIYRKKYDISWKQAIATAFIMIPFTVLLTNVLAWIENGFRDSSGANILRTFVYLPLICVLSAKLLKIPTGKMMDFVAPAVVLHHVIAQSVCPFLGCCAGIPWEWGIWNPLLNKMVFPIQWLISLVALGVFVLVLIYEKKNYYSGNGKAYALMLIMLGSTRFFLEFLKDGNKLIWGISSLAMHALFMMLVGAAWIFTMQEIELENKRKSGIKSRKS